MYYHEISALYQNIVVNSFSKQKYELPQKAAQNRRSKYQEVVDIPNYLNLVVKEQAKLMSHKKIRLYKGYLVNLTEFNGIEDMLAQNMGKNTRKNIRAKLKKLALNHTITYQYYYGDIDKKQYDFLFEQCHRLMKSRFDQKSIHNRFLLDWDFFHQLFYPKICAKEASMTVIYDGEKPITITLNFHQGDMVFSFIQIYDVDYHKYSMGDVAMYKNLAWSYDNKFTIWDVSKGETGNKLRWCNHQYDFECHIFYSPKSITAKTKANLRVVLFKTKQWLRQKGIIGGLFQLDSLYYYTKKRKVASQVWRVPLK